MYAKQVHTQSTDQSDFQISLVAASFSTTMRDASATKGNLWKVPRKNIRVIDGFNVRERTPKYLRHIDSIKASMMVDGWRDAEPIDGFCATVDEDGRTVDVVFVIGGHTRLEAHDLAVAAGRHIPYVPVVISDAQASMVDLTVRIWSGNNAMPLSPYEMSKLVKRLAGLGLGESEIGKRLNVTTQTVRDMLVLASAPSQVHERVCAGIMSPTLAVEMMREHGSRAVEEVEAAVKRASAEGKYRFTRQHVSGAKTSAAIKKSAAIAFELVRSISHDAAYSQLNPDLQWRIADLLQKVAGVTVTSSPGALPAINSISAFEAAIERISLHDSAANDEADVTFIAC